MAIEINAPNNPKTFLNKTSMFLAGTIEMGNSVDWQKLFFTRISSYFTEDNLLVFNPRRNDWDSSWEQSIENDKFREQVEWELSHLEMSDIVVFHFEPNSSSIITMLELGKFSNFRSEQKVLVHCPDDFSRKGNVDIFCNRYGVEQVDSFDELVNRTIDEVSKIIT